MDLVRKEKETGDGDRLCVRARLVYRKKGREGLNKSKKMFCKAIHCQVYPLRCVLAVESVSLYVPKIILSLQSKKHELGKTVNNVELVLRFVQEMQFVFEMADGIV